MGAKVVLGTSVFTSNATRLSHTYNIYATNDTRLFPNIDMVHVATL
jgi:hypothetical protein